MFVFTILTMYIGCDTLHDVLHPRKFLPSVSGCDTSITHQLVESLEWLVEFVVSVAVTPWPTQQVFPLQLTTFIHVQRLGKPYRTRRVTHLTRRAHYNLHRTRRVNHATRRVPLVLHLYRGFLSHAKAPYCRSNFPMHVYHIKLQTLHACKALKS